MKLNTLYLDLCNAEARMNLWNDDKGLNELSEKIKIETHNNFYIKLNLHLVELKRINLDFQENENIPVANRPSTDIIFDRLEELEAEYAQKVTDEYSAIIDLIQEFIEMSREYLIKIN